MPALERSALLAVFTALMDLIQPLEEITREFRWFSTELGWIGQAQNLDPAHSRPTIDAEAQRGRIKFTGKKPGFDSVSIYSRKKGDVSWNLIAVRKRKFPYYDESPLAVLNAPEVREYMTIGVVNDEEIGEPSEIKEEVRRVISRTKPDVAAYI